MADYYPLISRAVAGLEKNTGEARRALYERARAALVAQLRGVTPALSESDITRERLALEEGDPQGRGRSGAQFAKHRASPGGQIRSMEPRSTRSASIGGAAAGHPRPAEPVAPPRRYVTPSSQPPPEAPPAFSPDSARRREPVVAEPAGFAAVGFDLRPAAAAGAATRRRGARRRSRAPSPSRPPGSAAASRRPTSRAPSALTTGRIRPRRAPHARSAGAAERMFDRAAPHEPAPHGDFSEPMLEPSSRSTIPIPLSPRHGARRRRRSMPTWSSRPKWKKRRGRALLSRAHRLAVVALVFVAVVGLLLWQWPTMVALYSSSARRLETVRDAPPRQHAPEDRRPDRARHPAGTGDAGTRRAAAPARRRSCSTRRIRTIPPASATSARRCGAPRVRRARASRPTSRSAPTSKSPSARWR